MIEGGEMRMEMEEAVHKLKDENFGDEDIADILELPVKKVQ